MWKKLGEKRQRGGIRSKDRDDEMFCAAGKRAGKG